MNKAFEEIKSGLEEAIAFASGKDTGAKVHRPKPIDVKSVRKKLNMTQKAFADYFGVNLRTVQDWEQGRRVPSGPSRNFLFVIDREPEAVRRVLISP